jgi:prophage tail gpP-like protein
MALVHTATLTLADANVALDVWDEYAVELDMLRAGSPWTFTLYHSDDAQSAWDKLLQVVKCGDAVVLRVDDAPQLNGRVESVTLQRSRDAESMTLSGRDLAGVAMSWDADPRKVNAKGQTLGAVLQQLLEPLGIPLHLGADPAVAREVQAGLRPSARGSTARSRRQTVDRFHVQPGEKPWPLAERLCRRYGLLLWVAPDPAGRLAAIVDAPAYDGPEVYALRHVRGPDGTATPDSNVLQAEFKVQIQDTPTEVFVYGRGAQGDTGGPRLCAHVGNDRFDARFVRRPLPVQPRHFRAERARNPAQARQEGERLVSDAMAHHRLYTCTVQGHGAILGGKMRLYAINTLCRVRDEEFGLDEAMLLSRVRFQRSRRGGTTTQLTLHTKGALVVTPEPEA